MEPHTVVHDRSHDPQMLSTGGGEVRWAKDRQAGWLAGWGPPFPPRCLQLTFYGLGCNGRAVLISDEIHPTNLFDPPG